MIARKTNLIDRDKAKAAIKNAYQISNYKEPEIIFTGSPFGAIQKILATENYQSFLRRDIRNKFQKRVYIKPGTKVRLPSTGEYGIVVHCWYSEEIYDYDCYVAFYGTSFPDDKTDCRPYIFRYAAVALEILE